jgi:hypothetical protein
MNIFALDKDPVKAARYHCDKHVVKMITETVQLLSTAISKRGYKGCYRMTHKNHPCTLWLDESLGNFRWTVKLLEALHKQYQIRYGKHKEHKSYLSFKAWEPDMNEVLNIIYYQTGMKYKRTAFVQCMDEQYRCKDPVIAYRNYYRGAKSHIASWKVVGKPDWY